MNGLLPIGPADSKRQLLETSTARNINCVAAVPGVSGVTGLPGWGVTALLCSGDRDPWIVSRIMSR